MIKNVKLADLNAKIEINFLNTQTYEIWRKEIRHAIRRYAKANKNHVKGYDNNKKLSYFKYWDVNNLYGWAMSQKLPVNDFKRVEDISRFIEDFIKSYNDESDEEYFVENDVQYPKNLHNLHINLSFLPERIKLEKVEKLVANLYEKENM